MQPTELALFTIVAVLALALIGYVVWPTRRRGSRDGPPLSPDDRAAAPPPVAAVPPLACPACRREYAPGLRFCPHDARELTSAVDPRADAPGPGMTCPTCKRSFDGGRRFCAFDGEDLVPLTLALGGGAALPGGAPGKICPSCANRYDSGATFCGRDGAELVTVN